MYDQKNKKEYNRRLIDGNTDLFLFANRMDDKMADADKGLDKQKHPLSCQENKTLQPHRDKRLGILVREFSQRILGLGAKHAEKQSDRGSLHQKQFVASKRIE